MVSLSTKTFDGRTYYYLRECKRVDGRPKIVWQKYLGKAEDVAKAILEGPATFSALRTASIRQWGAVTALYDMAETLEVVQTIDRHVPKRTRTGPSVGTYLLIAALNRCVAPTSKARLAAWYDETVLPRLVGARASQLTSQRFWDEMDRLDDAAIRAIERDLTLKAVREYSIDARSLLFDETNFFTYIHSFNARSTLAQRGHSKEGRDSLRILGLALLVSADFEIPLFHHVYPGNQPDSPTFRSILDELVARYRLIAEKVDDVTLVFDKGNNAADILESIDRSPYHFVGSLVLTQHPQLLAIPCRHLAPLDQKVLPGVRARRLRRVAMGVERTVVVTFNDKLYDAQLRTLERERGKRLKQLRKQAASLRRWHEGKGSGRRPSKAAIKRTVARILHGQHMKALFHVKVGHRADGLPTLDYRFLTRAWRRLCDCCLGKTVLFTDRDDWSNEQIVTAYRSQWHVEHAFRRMKDTRYVSFRPQHHWTDQKIKVHALYCVVALLLASLLRRRLHEKGIDLAVDAMIEALAGIQEVHAYAAGKVGRPKLHRVLTQRSALQEKLVEALELEAYATA